MVVFRLIILDILKTMKKILRQMTIGFSPNAARWLALLVVVGVMLSPLMAAADGDDQEVALDALARGDAKPLIQLLEKVESLYQGTVLEVELETDEHQVLSDDGRALIYEIKLLTPQGNVVKLEFDAKTLELLEVDGHDSEKARKKRKKDHDDD